MSNNDRDNFFNTEDFNSMVKNDTTEIAVDDIIDNVLENEIELEGLIAQEEYEEEFAEEYENDSEESGTDYEDNYEIDYEPDDDYDSDYDNKPSDYSKIRRIVFIASNVILAASLILIAYSVFSAEEVEESVPQEGIVDLERTDALSVNEGEVQFEVLSKWKDSEWLKRNDHFIGWINIGETIIDYPVVQYLEPENEIEDSKHTGNTFYLYHTFDRNPCGNGDGTIYLDWHTPIGCRKNRGLLYTPCGECKNPETRSTKEQTNLCELPLRRPDNAIIYGHNRHHGGKFASLMRYYTGPWGKGDLTHYSNHPTVEFSTIYDDDRSTYKVFAAMFIHSNPNHGELFYYWRQRFFEDKGDFFDFVGEVMDRSVFYTDVDLEYGDELLTLQTCYYPFGNDSDRFVVFARRVREGESPEVDTSKAVINQSPKYFDLFYQLRGGSWGGRKWDTSKIKGFDEHYKNN
jgi:sortase B